MICLNGGKISKTWTAKTAEPSSALKGCQHHPSTPEIKTKWLYKSMQCGLWESKLSKSQTRVFNLLVDFKILTNTVSGTVRSYLNSVSLNRLATITLLLFIFLTKHPPPPYEQRFITFIRFSQFLARWWIHSNHSVRTCWISECFPSFRVHSRAGKVVGEESCVLWKIIALGFSE